MTDENTTSISTETMPLSQLFTEIYPATYIEYTEQNINDVEPEQMWKTWLEEALPVHRDIIMDLQNEYLWNDSYRTPLQISKNTDGDDDSADGSAETSADDRIEITYVSNGNTRSLALYHLLQSGMITDDHEITYVHAPSHITDDTSEPEYFHDGLLAVWRDNPLYSFLAFRFTVDGKADEDTASEFVWNNGGMLDKVDSLMVHETLWITMETASYDAPENEGILLMALDYDASQASEETNRANYEMTQRALQRASDAASEDAPDNPLHITYHPVPEYFSI